MLLSLGLIVLGLLLLVAGGELLLRGAVALATLLRLTPAVIGLTIVAAGTSVPELAVSSVAAFQGRVDVTVGNVVGSNIFNLTALLGLAALVRPLTLTGNTIKLEYPVLALVTLLFLVLGGDALVSRLDALLLVTVYVGFTAYLVRLVRQQMNASELQEYSQEVQELTLRPDSGPSWGLSLVFVVLGCGLLAGGAHSTVTGAVELARLLGMTERVIGLTIVAAGTGLPEVVTSMVSSYRGRDDVAVGNAIGSNLFNILIALGIPGLIRPLAVNAEVIAWDNWWMLGITLMLFPILYTGMRVSRWEGVLLLAVYVVYLTLVLYRPETATAVP